MGAGRHRTHHVRTRLYSQGRVSLRGRPHRDSCPTPLHCSGHQRESPGPEGWARICTVPSCRGSLGALLTHLHVLLPEEGFGSASLSSEQLLHQLLPRAAGTGRPQGGAFAQAERPQQPRVVQTGRLDEFMCRRRSRTHQNTQNFLQTNF